MPGHGGPRHGSVRLAREMYVTDPEGISLPALSRELKGKPGCSYPNLVAWSKKEGWRDQRLKHQETVAELTRLKSIPEVAKTLELIIKTRLALVNHAARSVAAGAANGEFMSFGTASTVVMNQGRELIEYYETVGMRGGGQAPEQVLTPEREKEILAIPNPLDEAEKEKETGDG